MTQQPEDGEGLVGRRPDERAEELTRSLFTRWSSSFEDMASSLRDTFSEDCVWDQRPMARTHGPDEAVRFLRLARRWLGLETADVEMLSLAVTSDGVVHTERIDHLRRADGRLIVSVPVAGVLRWRGDLVVSWREYFDVASVGGHALPRLVLDAAGGLGTVMRPRRGRRR